MAVALSRAGGVRVERTGADGVRVTGMDAAAVDHLAFVERVELHELAAERSDLERVFFALTNPPVDAVS